MMMMDKEDAPSGGDIYGSIEGGSALGATLGATLGNTLGGAERDGRQETPRPSMQPMAGRVNNATGVLDRYPTSLLPPPTRSVSRRGSGGEEGVPNPHLLRSLEGGGGGGTPSNDVEEGGFTLCPARGVLAGEGCETFSGGSFI